MAASIRFQVNLPLTLGSRVKAFIFPSVKRAIGVALAKIPSIAVDRITREANAVLHTTAPLYNRGLVQPGSITVKDDIVIISLVGDLPVALERGFGAFDIKAKMLVHASKFSKKGLPYIDVPFRHSMSDQPSNLPSVPPEIRRAMSHELLRTQAALRRAGANREAIATATARLSRRTPGKEFDKDILLGGTKTSIHVKHKRGLHDDLTRTAVYGHGKAIGTYHTFRRISPNSDPMSWWHPGFRGVRIFDKVAPTLADDVRREVTASLAAIGIKVKP